DSAALRHARHLAHHFRQIERVVQRRDAVRDVEGAVLERKVLAVGLYATELAVERAAAQPDLRVDEDVRRDVLAAALQPEPGRPGLRSPDLEHPEAAGVCDVPAEQPLRRMA